MEIIMIENEKQFKESIKKGITLIDFYADWCGPCKILTPVIDELKDIYKDKVTVLKVDIDKLPEVAAEYGVMSIPTVVILNGRIKVSDNLVGVYPKDFYIELLNNELGIENDF